MEVRFFGGLRLTVGGREQPLSSPRLRDLTAVLALAAGDLLPVRTIGDRVWGEDPPQRLGPTVQTGVSRLRKIVGADVVRAGPGSYGLMIPRSDVDVLRFSDEVERAARLPVPAAERAVLRAALAEWTGPPFADLASRWFADSVAPALTEQYLTARERRIDLDLADGGHEALVVELRELIAAYPLRESLWYRLIKLLAATGRQAEALAGYQEARIRTTAELGVEPGPELRALYAELLSTDAPAERPAGRRERVPRQLPPESVRMIGRDTAVKWLDDLVAELDRPDPPTVIAVISGVGGAGKTTLAVSWSHRVAHRFPDGQLYLNLRGFDRADVLATASALRGLLTGLGVHAERIPDDEESQAALLRSTLAGRRMLFLLDNARDADQIRPLLPAGGCMVVVTSRNRLRGLVVRDGAHRIMLTPLEPADSVRLIRAIAPQTPVDQLVELAQICGHLPLALAIAGEHAARLSPDVLAQLPEQMRNERQLLDAFEGDDSSTNLRVIFSWSHGALQPETARLYELLGLLPGPDFGVPVAAALIDASEQVTRRLLSQLADLHLVTELGHSRYRMHDLIRSHAAELAAALPDTATGPALDRVLAWYLYTSHNARLLRDDRTPMIALPPPPDGLTPLGFEHASEAVAWYDVERDSLAAAVRTAHATGRDLLAFQLIESCGGDLRGRDLDLLTELLELALDSSSRLDSTLPRAFVENALAMRYIEQGDDYLLGLDHLCRAQDLFAANGHQLGQARSLGNLAITYDALGRYDEAIDCYQRSLELKRQIGDKDGAARSLGNLGFTYCQLGRYDEAADALGQAITHFRTARSRRGEASALDTLGKVELGRGRYDEAISCGRESLRLHEDLGYPWGEAVVLTNLGRSYRAAGLPTEAADVWQRALAICERINPPASEDLDPDELRRLLAEVAPG